jgi:siroheme synthase-like protein
MTHYPVFLNLSGLTVALIGDGPEAEGRVPALIAAEATIRRLSPTDFSSEQLDGASLVICATNDEPLNARVSDAARARNIFCNVLDRPPLCSWIAPAVVRRGPLQIAVSTGGRSPALAVRIKETIAEVIGPEYETFLDMLYAMRDRVRERASTQAERGTIFQSMARGPALEMIREGRVEDAEHALQDALIAVESSSGLRAVPERKAC